MRILLVEDDLDMAATLADNLADTYQVDTAETVLPSMMIQPLVENAIWHGLMQATNDKMICIRFTQTENRISCTIEDNGIGIE